LEDIENRHKLLITDSTKMAEGSLLRKLV